jgi:hypothetical protein
MNNLTKARYFCIVQVRKNSERKLDNRMAEIVHIIIVRVFVTIDRYQRRIKMSSFSWTCRIFLNYFFLLNKIVYTMEKERNGLGRLTHSNFKERSLNCLIFFLVDSWNLVEWHIFFVFVMFGFFRRLIFVKSNPAVCNNLGPGIQDLIVSLKMWQSVFRAHTREKTGVLRAER